MVARSIVPHDRRRAGLAAVAGLVPTLMFSLWIVIRGWSGSPVEFAIAVTWILVLAIGAGLLVGPRIGPSCMSGVIGAAAYGFTASAIWIPIAAVASTLGSRADVRDASVGPGAFIVSLIGFLAYGALSLTYIWILLLPFGVGWIITFRLLERARPADPSLPEEASTQPTTSPRVGSTTMHPLARWVVGFGLGVADATLVGVGGIIPMVVLVGLAIVVAVRSGAVLMISGLMVGFGTAWLAFVALQKSSGGSVVDPAPWLAVGIIPVAIGSILGLVHIVRGRGHA